MSLPFDVPAEVEQVPQPGAAYQPAALGTTPTVAVAEDGSYALAWSEYGDVWIRLFDADGTPRTALLQATDAVADERADDVAITADGTLLVAVTRTDADGDSDLVVRRYDGETGALLGEVAVATGAALDGDASIDVFPDGGFVVAWDHLAGDAQSVRVQAFDADGTPRSAVIESIGGQNPDVTARGGSYGSGDLGFALAFEQAAGSQTQVILERYTAEGSLIDRQDVNPGGGNAVRPSLGMASDGSIVVAWSWGTFARFDADGVRVQIATPGDIDSEIAVSDDGRFSYLKERWLWDDTYVVELASYTASGEFADTGFVLSGEYYQDWGGQLATNAAGNRWIAAFEYEDDYKDGIDRAVFSGASYLQGGTDDDLLRGSPLSLNDADALVGGDGDDTLHGGVGADSLIGQAGDDLLMGGEGDDQLFGNEGADRLVGGAGLDVAIYSTSPDGVHINLASGWASGGFASGDTLIGIEDVTGSFFADLIVGNALDNRLSGLGGSDTLSGLGGNDSLDGRGGDDSLTGGQGDDTLAGWGGRDTLLGLGGADSLIGGAGGDSLVGGAGDDTLVMSSDADTLLGGAGDDLLLGSNGADLLDGAGSGRDTLGGGLGDDTMIASADGDHFDGGSGNDVVSYAAARSGVVLHAVTGGTGGTAAGDSYASVEVMLGSRFGDTMTGSVSPQEFHGGAGDDSLAGIGYHFGGAGNDTLHGRGDGGSGDDLIIAGITALGGAGNDTIEGGQWHESLMGGLGDDLLLGAEGNDTLRGDGGADTLIGGGGSDKLMADAGADSLVGGTGFDWVNYLASGVGVLIDLDRGVGGRGLASGDRFDQIEGVIGSSYDDTMVGSAVANQLLGGAGADSLAGGAGADTLDGSGGADTLQGGSGTDYLIGAEGFDELYGGAGDDALDGGAGNDLLVGGSGADFLRGGAGSDTASYAESELGVVVDLASGRGSQGHAAGDLYDSIENVTGSGYADSLLGEGSANRLLGGEGDDVLDGGSGGDDTLDGGGGADTLVGGIGRDRLVGGEGDDLLQGVEDADLLVGGAGDDTLNGGSGRDEMSGGAGADRFLFTSVSHSPAGAGRDVILDFGGQDLIDLAPIDANESQAGNQAFVYIDKAAFSGTAGELRFAGGLLQGDVDGDGLADFQVELAGVARLEADSLLL